MARARKTRTHYRVCYTTVRFSKVKYTYFKGEFDKRAKARRWCANNPYWPDLILVHPDGTREPYVSNQYKDGQYVGVTG